MFGRRGTYEVSSRSSESQERRPSTNPIPKGHIRCTIHLLDDRLLVEDFPKRVSGKALEDLVFTRIDLVETDYFGLMYTDKAEKTLWLDPLKTVKKQVKNRKEVDFFFRVKFYIADPSNIQEELTRFLYFLQVKQDILRNRLPVNFSTAAILSAYALQAEVGDHDPASHSEGYVSEYRYVPNQGEELEEQIEMHHKTLSGMLPADCEFHYLERAQRLELYGVDLHFAQDAEDEELMLGVMHSGVCVFQNKHKINFFHWAMMRKIGFKKHKFYLYIRGIEANQEPSIVGFFLPDYRSCKILWKTCVAHHTFFRAREPQPAPKLNGLLRFGSKYRYSGRTLNMTVEHGREEMRPDYELKRPPSKRYQRRSVGGYSSRRDKDLKQHQQQIQQQQGTPPAGRSGNGVARRDADGSDLPPKPTEVYDEEYYRQEEEKVEENYPPESILPNGLLKIRVVADDQGRYGFNVRGGHDQNEPVRISKISEGTPASLAKPRPREGDIVEEINGQDVSGLSHHEIVDLIRATRSMPDPRLTVIVRPKNPVPEALLFENRSKDLHETMKRKSKARMTQQSGPTDLLGASIEVLKESLAAKEGVEQFEQLYRRHPSMRMDDGFQVENYRRNRYRDISPYNATRVKLQEGSDYINASHVRMDAGDGVLNYIAAQGPLEHTSGDFWQMIAEQKCSVIVMVTRLQEGGRQKCHQYWPEIKHGLKYDELQVVNQKEEEDVVLGTVRTLELTNHKTNEVRQVTQYQYKDWPDHQTPDDNSRFINLITAINSQRSGNEPLLVHCSAGVGRTGMFITMETAICMMRANEPVFPLEIVQKVRDQRPMVIQTKEQYEFTCQAIVFAFEGKLYYPRSSAAMVLDSSDQTGSVAPTSDDNDASSEDKDKERRTGHGEQLQEAKESSSGSSSSGSGSSDSEDDSESEEDEEKEHVHETPEDHGAGENGAE